MHQSHRLVSAAAIVCCVLRFVSAAPDLNPVSDGVPTVINVIAANPKLPEQSNIFDPDGVIVRIERGAVLHGRTARWTQFAPVNNSIAFFRVEAVGDGPPPLINAAIMLSRMAAIEIAAGDFT
jgi:hypothetical protein